MALATGVGGRAQAHAWAPGPIPILQQRPRLAERRSRRAGRQSPGSVQAAAAGGLFGPGMLSPGNTVKVYEAGKQASGKRIVAETVVQAPVDIVWRVLTNYERLADFVPNLESCERLPSPRAGKVLIRQRGCSQGVLWRLEAEALLEVEELQMPLGRREARFSMVEGDFQEMAGRWVVEPDPSSAVGMATLLRFDVIVRPKITLPSAIVSYVVRAGLPANIQAVSRRAEEIAANKLRVSGLARWAGTEDDVPIPGSPTQQADPPRSSWEQEVAEEEAARVAAAAAADDELSSQQQDQPQRRQAAASGDEGLPSKGPFWRFTGSTFPEAAPLTAAQQRQRLGLRAEEVEEEDSEEDIAEQALAGSQRPLQWVQPQRFDPQSLYLGVVSVPLPPAGNRASMQPQTQQELDQQQAEKERLQSTYPAFGLRREGGRSSSGTATAAAVAAPAPAGPAGAGTRVASATAAEVHLRRLDTFDVLHRRAVAAITIDAPPEAVWAVLTDYNRLAEFIPNLAISQRIALPSNAPSNIIRVRQVGYKRMLYMCLHAESVLDLIEKPLCEIQFRQVAGDFERFQGKWMLQGVEPSGSGGSSSSDSESAAQTQLKYAVEIVIPRSTRMLGVLEPLLERTVFEDVPANLAAIKQRVETMQMERSIQLLEEAGEAMAAAALRRKLERPSQSDLVEDFAVLAAELERCFGDKRVLPSRSELRETNRVYLEKAISAHGGPSVVAQRLGWKLKAKGRRPKGYWDSLENVRSELDEFIDDQGLQPGVMPAKNDFVRAGRYDIARAVERWGGLYELAEELGYAVGDASSAYARRSMQGSMDSADDFVLAGMEDSAVTAATAAAIAAAAAANGSSREVSNGAAPPSSSSSNGNGNGSSGKARSKASAQKRAPSRPSVREEIDAW